MLGVVDYYRTQQKVLSLHSAPLLQRWVVLRITASMFHMDVQDLILTVVISKSAKVLFVNAGTKNRTHGLSKNSLHRNAAYIDFLLQ